MTKTISALAAALALFLAAPALPAAASNHQAATTGTAEGVVRKIDKEAGKITIRHGPIAGLDMPAMSMVFRAKEAALLDKVKVGDKIHFDVLHDKGAFFVTGIETAN